MSAVPVAARHSFIANLANAPSLSRNPTCQRPSGPIGCCGRRQKACRSRQMRLAPYEAFNAADDWSPSTSFGDRNSSGSRAKIAAIRRASSRVSTPALRAVSRIVPEVEPADGLAAIVLHAVRIDVFNDLPWRQELSGLLIQWLTMPARAVASPGRCLVGGGLSHCKAARGRSVWKKVDPAGAHP